MKLLISSIRQGFIRPAMCVAAKCKKIAAAVSSKFDAGTFDNAKFDN